MKKIKDLSGEKFGKLTVIKKLQGSDWLCKCDCGNEKIVQTSSLKSGRTKSYGCGRIKEDLTGKKFGRLTVIKRAENSKSNQPRWLCRCECGTEKIILAQSLKRGGTKSCGCYQDEVKRNSHQNLKHGQTGSRLYKIWANMKKRCYNPKDKRYHCYGARGITVCEEWKNDFIAFHDWAYANGYDDTVPRGVCTIDRIDTNGNYCPENCRWVDNDTQAKTRTTTIYLTYNNETHTLIEWSKIMNIPRNTLYMRIKESGYSIEEALTKPVISKKRKIVNDK